MRTSRIVGFLVLLIAAIAASWWFLRSREPAAPATITVYYAKLDGTTMVPWQVTLGPARDPKSVAFYAAVQAVAGPPAGTDAVRFPSGTHVLSADVDEATVDVDLSNNVAKSAEGGFTESAEFKSLVYTLTGLPGITSVRVRVAGTKVASLPGGHLELDEPLTRQSF